MTWIEEIENYIPINDQEKNDKEFILEAVKANSNILTRENKIMHLTSSGYIINKTYDKVLMIYHKIYNSWSWTGGHNDGDSNLLHVAIKEAKEETGLKNFIPIENKIFSLDVLPVNGHYKNGVYISSHLHLSIAYLLIADENEPLVLNSEETKGIMWIPLEKLSEYCSEPNMLKLYRKFNEKINLT